MASIQKRNNSYQITVSDGSNIQGKQQIKKLIQINQVIPLQGSWHTSATLLISQNVDVKTVSNRLGHAQTSTTMNIYAHSLKKMDEKAADTLEQLIQRR